MEIVGSSYLRERLSKLNAEDFVSNTKSRIKTLEYYPPWKSIRSFSVLQTPHPWLLSALVGVNIHLKTLSLLRKKAEFDPASGGGLDLVVKSGQGCCDEDIRAEVAAAAAGGKSVETAESAEQHAKDAAGVAVVAKTAEMAQAQDSAVAKDETVKGPSTVLPHQAGASAVVETVSPAAKAIVTEEAKTEGSSPSAGEPSGETPAIVRTPASSAAGVAPAAGGAARAHTAYEAATLKPIPRAPIAIPSTGKLHPVAILTEASLMLAFDNEQFKVG